jgi:hypothetical protein
MNPTLRLGLLAFGIVFSLAAVVVVIALVASESAPEPPPTTAAPPPPPPRSKPTPPPPTAAPAVFTSRKLFESVDSMEPYRGKRLVVVGPVTKLDTTSLTARISWQVPEGLRCAYLSDDPERDQPQVICVFQAGRRALLGVGALHHIEGTYRGPLSTSGVPLLIECQVVARPERPNPAPAETKSKR